MAGPGFAVPAGRGTIVSTLANGFAIVVVRNSNKTRASEQSFLYQNVASSFLPVMPSTTARNDAFSCRENVKILDAIKGFPFFIIRLVDLPAQTDLTLSPKVVGCAPKSINSDTRSCVSSNREKFVVGIRIRDFHLYSPLSCTSCAHVKRPIASAYRAYNRHEEKIMLPMRPCSCPSSFRRGARHSHTRTSGVRSCDIRRHQDALVRS